MKQTNKPTTLLGREERRTADHRNLVERCFLAPEGVQSAGLCICPRRRSASWPMGAATGHSSFAGPHSNNANSMSGGKLAEEASQQRRRREQQLQKTC